MLIVSCGRENKPSNEAIVPAGPAAMRFEEDLLTYGATQPFELKRKYPSFFELFFFQVVGIGNPDSVVLARRITDFAKDSDIVAIGREVKAMYGDFSTTDKSLSDALGEYHLHFPKRVVPRTLTFISGFNNAIVCTDSILGIGLDMYLGSDSKYYKALQFPVYRSVHMRREYIPTDALKGWLQSEWTEPETNADLLSHLVYEGKIQYALKSLMPDVADTLRTGYSKAQQAWCEANEKNTWSFFIDHKLLFATEQNQVMKYVTEGPTTNGFPKEAPGNIGLFIGARIVEAYMEEHKDLPLEKLMADNDYKKILLESKYKP